MIHHSGRIFVVDLNARSCSCNAWDLNGLPHLHACVALSWFRENPKDYINDRYKKETYLRTYKPIVMPMTS